MSDRDEQMYFSLCDPKGAMRVRRRGCEGGPECKCGKTTVLVKSPGTTLEVECEHRRRSEAA